MWKGYACLLPRNRCVEVVWAVWVLVGMWVDLGRHIVEAVVFVREGRGERFAAARAVDSAVALVGAGLVVWLAAMLAGCQYGAALARETQSTNLHLAQVGLHLQSPIDSISREGKA